MDRKIRSKLRDERRARIDDLAESLRQGDMSHARETLSWIETLDKLRTFRWRERSWAWYTLLGLACVGIAAFAISVRVWSTRALIDVSARGADVFTSERTPVHASTPMDSLWVGGAVATNSVDPGVPTDTFPAGIALKGKELLLDSLIVEGPAVVKISSTSTCLQVQAWSRQATGRIKFTSARLADGSTSWPLQARGTGEPYDLSFTCLPDSNVPIDVRFGNVGRWTISTPTVDSVVLFAESPPSSGRFVSTIDSGRVVLADVGEATNVKSGESLVFRLKKVHEFAIDGRAGNLHVAVDADVTQLDQSAMRVDLMPRLVTYLEHSPIARIFWAALVFLWGLAYGVWRVVQR
jgi:hypothetical protein